MPQCRTCHPKKVFKNRRGLEQHNRMVHKVPDSTGAPVSTPTKTNSPEIKTIDSKIQQPDKSSKEDNSTCTTNKDLFTKIDNLQEEIVYLKNFVTALINSLGSEFHKTLSTLTTRINRIDPPVIEHEIQLPTRSPVPANTDTPFMPVLSGPSRTIPKQNSCIQLTNRFRDLEIPSEQSNQQHDQQRNLKPTQNSSVVVNHPPPQRQQFNQASKQTGIPVVPGEQSYSNVVNSSSPQSHHQIQRQQQIIQHQNHRPTHPQRQRNPQPPQQQQQASRVQQSQPPNSYNNPQDKQKYKLGLLGDSNFRYVNIRELNRATNHRAFIDKFAHSGATTSHLITYADVALLKRPDGLIIHGGTNDIIGRNATNQNADQIACNLIELGVKARNAKVKDIFISSVLPTKDAQANEKALHINQHLKAYCTAYSFVYIDNSNITEEDLKEDERDRVHLSASGSDELMKNLAYYFNY